LRHSPVDKDAALAVLAEPSPIMASATPLGFLGDKWNRDHNRPRIVISVI